MPTKSLRNGNTTKSNSDKKNEFSTVRIYRNTKDKIDYIRMFRALQLKKSFLKVPFEDTFDLILSQYISQNKELSDFCSQFNDE